MNQKKYKTWFAGALLIHFVSILLIMIYILIGCYYQVWVDEGWLSGKLPPYYKSRDYAENVNRELTQLIEYLRLRENFETDGEFCADKLVDIYNYAHQGKIDGTVTNGLAYSIDQLYQWSKQKDSYSWWSEYLESGDAVPPGNMWIGEGSSKLGEIYPPWGYDSLSEFISSEENIDKNSGDYWSAEITRCLMQIDEEMPQYLKSKEQFMGNHTNIKYRAENLDTGQVYKNYTKESDKVNSERILYNSDTYFLDTDISFTYDMKYDIVRQINEKLSPYGKYKVSVWVDRDFVVKDVLWSGNQLYKKCSWVISSFPIGMIGAGAGFFATLLFICAVTGKTPAKKKGFLYLMDCIYIEIILASICILASAIGILFADTLQDILPFSRYIIRILVLLVLYGLLLTVFLGLVHRRRAESLKDKSILVQIYRNYREGLSAGRQGAYVLLVFLLYGVGIYLLGKLGIAGFIISIVMILYMGSHVLKEMACIDRLNAGARQIAEKDASYKIPLEGLSAACKSVGENINKIGGNLENAVQESVRNERRKAELIANVSHDLKTPLTSIIGYIGLLKREETVNPKIEEYTGVLEKKTQRLKLLMDDLLEISRINAGNFNIQTQRMDFREFQQQVQGEFYELLQENHLDIVNRMPEHKVMIQADGRALWRVMENLYGNIAKYALPGSRVYVEMDTDGSKAYLYLKNISRQILKIPVEELTERFIQGDESRSTEGSGLGLSIAKNLVQIMGGSFEIYVDGDLFKIILAFPLEEEKTV